MARPLRIEYPGAWYHVTSRGNEKAELFHDDTDRRSFITILGESIDAFRAEIHGFVLMHNHFHLLLHTPRGNASRFMQRLNTAYTVFFNRRHTRSGHLFQGRFKGILIDKDPYLLGLSRYIHLNPVKTEAFSRVSRENKLRYLDSYPWSSYPSYIRKEPKYDFVHTEMILPLLDSSPARARRRYCVFVREGLKDDLKNPLLEARGIVLGRAPFIKWAYETFIEDKAVEKEYAHLKESIPEISLDRIAGCVAAEFEIHPSEILRRRSPDPIARQFLIEFCCRFLVSRNSLREIGRKLDGISVSALGLSRKRFMAGIKCDQQLQGRFEKIRIAILS